MITITFLFSNRPLGLLLSPAICLQISLLTFFLRGRSEASILVVWNVPFDLYAAANFCYIFGSILLCVLYKCILLPMHYFCGPKDYSQQFLFKNFTSADDKLRSYCCLMIQASLPLLSTGSAIII